MSAVVKRAISASLDRINATTRRDVAVEELRVRAELERHAVRAVPEAEAHDYQVGLTNALSDQQVAAAQG